MSRSVLVLAFLFSAAYADLWMITSDTLIQAAPTPDYVKKIETTSYKDANEPNTIYIICIATLSQSGQLHIEKRKVVVGESGTSPPELITLVQFPSDIIYRDVDITVNGNNCIFAALTTANTVFVGNGVSSFNTFNVAGSMKQIEVAPDSTDIRYLYMDDTSFYVPKPPFSATPSVLGQYHSMDSVAIGNGNIAAASAVRMDYFILVVASDRPPELPLVDPGVNPSLIAFDDYSLFLCGETTLGIGCAFGNASGGFKPRSNAGSIVYQMPVISVLNNEDKIVAMTMLVNNVNTSTSYELIIMDCNNGLVLNHTLMKDNVTAVHSSAADSYIFLVYADDIGVKMDTVYFKENLRPMTLTPIIEPVSDTTPIVPPSSTNSSVIAGPDPTILGPAVSIPIAAAVTTGVILLVYFLKKRQKNVQSDTESGDKENNNSTEKKEKSDSNKITESEEVSNPPNEVRLTIVPATESRRALAHKISDPNYAGVILGNSGPIITISDASVVSGDNREFSGDTTSSEESRPALTKLIDQNYAGVVHGNKDPPTKKISDQNYAGVVNGNNGEGTGVVTSLKVSQPALWNKISDQSYAGVILGKKEPTKMKKVISDQNYAGVVHGEHGDASSEESGQNNRHCNQKPKKKISPRIVLGNKEPSTKISDQNYAGVVHGEYGGDASSEESGEQNYGKKELTKKISAHGMLGNKEPPTKKISDQNYAGVVNGNKGQNGGDTTSLRASQPAFKNKIGDQSYAGVILGKKEKIDQSYAGVVQGVIVGNKAPSTKKVSDQNYAGVVNGNKEPTKTISDQNYAGVVRDNNEQNSDDESSEESQPLTNNNMAGQNYAGVVHGGGKPTNKIGDQNYAGVVHGNSEKKLAVQDYAGEIHGNKKIMKVQDYAGEVHGNNKKPEVQNNAGVVSTVVQGNNGRPNNTMGGQNYAGVVQGGNEKITEVQMNPSAMSNNNDLAGQNYANVSDCNNEQYSSDTTSSDDSSNSSSYDSSEDYEEPEIIPPAITEAEIDRRLRIKYSSLVFGKKIGAGSFGKVYLGEWTGADVAIKVNNLIADAPTFLAEAKLTLLIAPHPNLVRTYGVSLDGPNPCIVLEYCGGGSLDQLLETKNYAITHDRRKELALKIAYGLLHLHNNNIVHRDLAARNILLTKDGQPKVSDFGMSRVVQDPTAAGKTKNSVGPVRWMAPENLVDMSYSTKSDVWSYGILVFEIVSGEQPHLYEDQLIVAARIRDEGYTPRIPNSCDPTLRHVMEMCWRFDPAQRPTMEEIADYIRKH